MKPASASSLRPPPSLKRGNPPANIKRRWKTRHPRAEIGSASEKSNAPPNPISVCFFEQNPICLDYLRHLLRGHEFQEVSEEEACPGPWAQSGRRLIVVLDESVLSLEHRLVLQNFKARFADASFLVLGKEWPQGEGCERLRGIDGLVLYSQAKEELVPALRALRKGWLWLPRAVLEYFARLAAKGSLLQSKKGQPFTPREKAVIGLLARGLCNKEIGNELGIAETTVKFHLANVFAKLGVHDRYSASEVAHSVEGVKTKGPEDGKFVTQ